MWVNPSPITLYMRGLLPEFRLKAKTERRKARKCGEISLGGSKMSHRTQTLGDFLLLSGPMLPATSHTAKARPQLWRQCSSHEVIVWAYLPILQMLRPWGPLQRHDQSKGTKPALSLRRTVLEPGPCDLLSSVYLAPDYWGHSCSQERGRPLRRRTAWGRSASQTEALEVPHFSCACVC